MQNSMIPEQNGMKLLPKRCTYLAIGHEEENESQFCLWPAMNGVICLVLVFKGKVYV
jgi:hypothetical protein